MEKFMNMFIHLSWRGIWVSFIAIFMSNCALFSEQVVITLDLGVYLICSFDLKEACSHNENIEELKEMF